MPRQRKAAVPQSVARAEAAARLYPDWRERISTPGVPRVEVVWMDACTISTGYVEGPKGAAQRATPGVVQRTLGWLVRADRKWVTLAADLEESGLGYRCLWDIPRSIVLEIRILNV
jgi:hypothetical protein